MKRLTVAAFVLVAAVAAPALAGGPRSPVPHPEPAEVADKLAEHLGLEDATAETIEAILEGARTEGRVLVERMKTVFEAVKAEREAAAPNDKKVAKLVHEAADLRAELGLLKMRTFDEIKAQLTPEQAAKLEAFRQRRVEGLRQRVRAAVLGDDGGAEALDPLFPGDGL